MKKLLIGLACVALIGLLFSFSAYRKRSCIEGALAVGRLAPLPVEAHNVQAATEGSLFARSFWVTFTASNADIQHWVEQSPALIANKPAPCSQPVQFGEHPTWFQPESIRHGLLYLIPQDRNADYGTIWIDSETQTVYIKTSHS